MNASVVWDHPAPHVIRCLAEPGHIDVMNHVNNVVYQQWMEAVAWSHSQSVGLGPADYQRHGYGMVVHRHEMDFLAAAYLGDELLVATWLLSVDRLSTERVYQMVRASDGKTVFRGRTRLVCIDIASGRLRRMPPVYHEVYSALVVDQSA